MGICSLNASNGPVSPSVHGRYLHLHSQFSPGLILDSAERFITISMCERRRAGIVLIDGFCSI